MPKQRQIPGLFPREHADGTTVWHWKPSKQVRALGFRNVQLGTDPRAAVLQAMDLNAQVDALRAGAAAPAAAGPRLPRVVRFAELVSRYRAHDAFTSLRDATRAEYDVRLRQLATVFLDGELPARDVSPQVVSTLLDSLLANSSRNVAASTMRILRLLMNFAVRQGIVATNPTHGIKAPLPPPRKVQMGTAVREAIVEAAGALGLDDIAFAVPLAYWMLQREGDVLALSRLGWREIEVRRADLDGAHRAALVNDRGRMMGFRLAQQKTGTWIDAPIPPTLHAAIEARLRASPAGWLFPRPTDPTVPLHEKTFQRQFAEARGSAWAVAIMRGDPALAAAIEACQFRDLRRTGMVAYGSAGARLQWITALSGHAVIGRRTILDTYMPGDTEGACACVATGVLAEQRRMADRVAGA